MDAQSPQIVSTSGDISHRDWVAIILAMGLSLAFNMLMIAILLSPDVPISSNSTQLISGAFSGVIGVLGVYLGFKAGTRQQTVTVRKIIQDGKSRTDEESTSESDDDDGIPPVNPGEGWFPGVH